MLYRWNDRKFENEYLKKLERNQKRQKRETKTKKKNELISFSKSRNFKGEVILDMQNLNVSLFIYFFFSKLRVRVRVIL